MADTPHTAHSFSLFLPVFLSLFTGGEGDNIPLGKCELDRVLVRSLRLNVSAVSPHSVLLTWNNTDQYLSLEAVFSFVGKRWTKIDCKSCKSWKCGAVGTQFSRFQVTITKYSSTVSRPSPVIKCIWGAEMTQWMLDQKLFTSIHQVDFVHTLTLSRWLLF